MLASFSAAALAVLALATQSSAQASPDLVISTASAIPICAVACFPTKPTSTLEAQFFCQALRGLPSSVIIQCATLNCGDSGDVERSRQVLVDVAPYCGVDGAVPLPSVTGVTGVGVPPSATGGGVVVRSTSVASAAASSTAVVT
ncbi:hypothetical protein HDU67_007351, partial [Dinochytrium kinnereticum]